MIETAQVAFNQQSQLYFYLQLTLERITFKVLITTLKLRYLKVYTQRTL